MDTRFRHMLEIVWIIASLGFVAWGFTNLLSLDKIVDMPPARAAGLLLAVLAAPVFLRVLLEIFFPRQARQAPEVKPPGSSFRAGDVGLVVFMGGCLVLASLFRDRNSPFHYLSRPLILVPLLMIVLIPRIRREAFKDFWPWKKVRFRSIQYVIGILAVIVLTGTLLTNQWTIALFLVAAVILTVSVYWYVKQQGMDRDSKQ